MYILCVLSFGCCSGLVCFLSLSLFFLFFFRPELTENRHLVCRRHEEVLKTSFELFFGGVISSLESEERESFTVCSRELVTPSLFSADIIPEDSGSSA